MQKSVQNGLRWRSSWFRRLRRWRTRRGCTCPLVWAGNSLDCTLLRTGSPGQCRLHPGRFFSLRCCSRFHAQEDGRWTSSLLLAPRAFLWNICRRSLHPELCVPTEQWLAPENCKKNVKIHITYSSNFVLLLLIFKLVWYFQHVNNVQCVSFSTYPKEKLSCLWKRFS